MGDRTQAAIEYDSRSHIKDLSLDPQGKRILDGARTALVDSSYGSDEGFCPRFVSNDFRHGRKVISTLESELARCSSFDLSVAFVTYSGIVALLQTLRELERAGVPGRILTTDYLAFSDPRALEKLDSFSNIELRMYVTSDAAVQHGFHTKGYLFRYSDDTEKVLIGSSNLTASALAVNREWNLEFLSTTQGLLVSEIRAEYEDLWAAARPLSDIIDTYRQMHAEKARVLARQDVIELAQARLEPNAMQLQFVHNLDDVLRKGATRALLISATGTGKTYASAFAMRHLDPRRILFLAHREQVLKQSMTSYQRVLGHSKTYGLLSGSSHVTSTDCVFATMQTMSRDSYLEQFGPQDFDIVIIDEVHRAGSASYQKIMGHFRPRLYLGMTASPDRPDGFDIYGLFDNQIVYEIRLQGALENDLLCPFHYFGITDIEVDGSPIDESANFNVLVSDSRVNHIVEQARFYGYSGDRVKGLMFCSTNREASELSARLNERGLRTLPLSGADSQEARERAISRLVCKQSDELYPERLDYLLSVDIFNEGVDIPEVNQVIMLRPTESPVVFVQQLGRGLRKSAGKEFVVVIDFIGNYANNYMIPIALSGDRSYNKDGIRKYLMEGGRVIPGCSSVHFDEIARSRIFASIDNTGVTLRFLKEKYLALKHKLGRIPLMLDFLRYGEVDPLLFVESKKSYYRFLASVEKGFAREFSEKEQLALEYVSRYFANGMRPHELLALRELVEEGAFSHERLRRALGLYGVATLDDKTFASTVGVLDKSFVNAPSDKAKYGRFEFVEYRSSSQLECSDDLRSMLSHEEFRRALVDLIDFGLARYREKYANDDHGLTLYEKYTRKDVCRLLNWEKDNSSTVYGYRVSYGTCPIFVTYEKSEDIASSTQYADVFESPRIFSWMTRSRLTLESPEVRKLINAERDGIDMRLFVKKSDSEGSDFYYFGRVRPIDWRQTVQRDDHGNELPIVNFKLELEHPAQDDLYEYFDGPVPLSPARVA
jgi:superfamily II DNA or RNA helicase